MASVPAGAAFDLREHASASSARCTRREIAKVTELVRTLKVGECRFGRTCDVVLSEPASKNNSRRPRGSLLHGQLEFADQSDCSTGTTLVVGPPGPTPHDQKNNAWLNAHLTRLLRRYHRAYVHVSAQNWAVGAPRDPIASCPRSLRAGLCCLVNLRH